jgi:Protein of unknown function (DUF4231)
VSTFEYPEKRLEDRIKFYDREGRRNKRWYHTLQIIIIVASAIIPIVNLADFANLETRLASSILGSLVVILTGYSQLGKFHETWLLKSATEHRLRTEKHLFENCAGHYSGKNQAEKNKLLVETTESIISTELSKYFSERQPTDRHDN